MTVSVLSLWLPILLCGVALFFASFASWMVVRLHATDWRKLDKEDEFLEFARKLELKQGSYMFPCCENPADMNGKEFQAKMKQGPNGIITVFGEMNMGKNLIQTFIFFTVVSLCLGYLTGLSCEAGETYKAFRVASTAALLAYLTAMIQHSIWFKNRIVGHVIESIAYALITGGIFALLWPAAETAT